MITFKQTGDFSKLNRYFERLKEVFKLGILDKYGRAGVSALQAATPVDTGQTANSWYYKIERNNGTAAIHFCNDNIQNGVLVAILLQYGHATVNGGWVMGSDYINPSTKPVFDRIAEDAWREVTSL